MIVELNQKLIPYFEKLAQRAIEARVKGDGKPFVIGHFLTARCMCKCKSCLWRFNDWEDVPTDEMKRFYAEAAEEGFAGTAFSGGEPFLRKDLGELTKFVKEECGVPILLFTTGWYLDEERIDEILPHVAMLFLSLDASTAERHDEIRGLPGLFDKLMKGVDLVTRKYPDLSVQFNACVQKGIAEDIDGMIKIAEDKGVKMSFDIITDYRHGEGDSNYTHTDMGLPPQEQRGVAAYLLEKKAGGAPILNSEMYFKYFVDGKPGYKCHFPKIAMCINGRGDVEDCLNLDKNIANIREMPCKEIMALPRFKQMRKDAEDCCSCNSPTMVDLSYVWEDPQLLFQQSGITVA